MQFRHMKYRKHHITLLIFGIYGLLNQQSFGQAKSIPPNIIEKFAVMFPRAKNVEWMDKLDHYQVYFKIDQAKAESKFNKSGKWLSTEMQSSIDSLPVLFKNELQSKYAGYSIQSVFKMDFSDKGSQYRIVASKDNGPRRILSFDQNGQLLADHVSL